MRQVELLEPGWLCAVAMLTKCRVPIIGSVGAENVHPGHKAGGDTATLSSCDLMSCLKRPQAGLRHPCPSREKEICIVPSGEMGARWGCEVPLTLAGEPTCDGCSGPTVPSLSVSRLCKLVSRRPWKQPGFQRLRVRPDAVLHSTDAGASPGCWLPRWGWVGPGAQHGGCVGGQAL